MKHPLLNIVFALLACAGISTLMFTPAQAAPGHKKDAHTKDVHKKDTHTKETHKKRRALPPAGPEQLDAARYALVGKYQCAGGRSITLLNDDRNPGYFTLIYGKNTWSMKAMLSPTGAVRIEDVKGELLLLQIAYKSMLLNEKSGQRVLDGCVHPTQRAAEKAARNQPRPRRLLR